MNVKKLVFLSVLFFTFNAFGMECEAAELNSLISCPADEACIGRILREGRFDFCELPFDVQQKITCFWLNENKFKLKYLPCSSWHAHSNSIQRLLTNNESEDQFCSYSADKLAIWDKYKLRCIQEEKTPEVPNEIDLGDRLIGIHQGCTYFKTKAFSSIGILMWSKKCCSLADLYKKNFVVGCEDGTINICFKKSLLSKKIIQLHRSAIISLLRLDKLLVSADIEGNVDIHNLSNFELLESTKKQVPVTSLLALKDKFVSGHEDGRLQVWQRPSLEFLFCDFLQTETGQKNPNLSAVFPKDNPLLLTLFLGGLKRDSLKALVDKFGVEYLSRWCSQLKPRLQDLVMAELSLI